MNTNIEPFFRIALVFGILFFLLWMVNLPQSRRYKQRWLPVAALFCVIVAIFFYRYLYEPVQHFLDTIAGSYFPSSGRQGVAIMLNLAVLGAFLALKFLLLFWIEFLLLIRKFWSWLMAKLRKQIPEQMEASAADLFPAYNYSQDKAGIQLADGWVYPAAFLRCASGIAIAVLLFFLWQDYVAPDWQIPLTPFALPVLPALLFFESACYLGGPRLPREAESFDVHGIGSIGMGDYGSLWEKYNRLWPQRVLAATKLVHSVTGQYAATRQEGHDAIQYDSIPELELIKRNFAKQNILLDPEQNSLLADLWVGKDLLLYEKTFIRCMPPVCAVLQNHLLKGGNILVLCPHDASARQREELAGWLRDQLAIPALSRVVFSLKQGGAPVGSNVFLADVMEAFELVRGEANTRWFKNLTAVVVLEAAATLFSMMPFATVFFNLLVGTGQARNKQFIILAAEERDNMEAALREFLGITPLEIRLPAHCAATSRFIVWRAEGQEPLTAALRLGNTKDLGPLALAVPAFDDGVGNLHYYGIEGTPWNELREELDKVYKKGNLAFHQMVPVAQPPARAVVIGWDSGHAIPSALLRGLCFSGDEVLAQLYSSPYLLREYFAANIDFFLECDGQVGSLAPVPSRDRSSVARLLLERLYLGSLDENEILFQLNILGTGSETAEEKLLLRSDRAEQKLLRLFQDMLALGSSRPLTVQEHHTWDRKEKQFQKTATISLARTVADTVPSILSEVFALTDPSNNVLARIPRDHLYQNYLPELIYSFEGEPFFFFAKDIDHTQKRISLSHAQPRGLEIHRVAHTVNLSAMRKVSEPRQQEIGDYRVSVQLHEAECIVTLRELTVFHHMATFATSTKESVNGIPRREYQHARLLSLSLSPQKDSTPPLPPEFAFSLALLLTEILPTVFPESYQYLLVIPGNDYKPENEYSRLVPVFEPPFNPGERETKGITLYFLEDSTMDMGLVTAVHDRWMSLCELVEDYLEWFEETKQGEDEATYLSFGLGKQALAVLGLDRVKEVLNSLLAHRTDSIRNLRKNGKKYQGTAALPAGEHQCDFCGVAISSAEFEQLEDGRERCVNCRSTAVNSQEDLLALYEDARSWLVTQFKLELRQKMQVVFISSAELHNHLGEFFKPTSACDPRPVGFARKDGNEFMLCLENGQPHHIAYATVLHELTHIWQYDNLDMETMKREHGDLHTEGHAMWVELNGLQAKGIGPLYCKKEAARADIYGQGYRAVNTLVEQSGGSDPFTVMQQIYPKAL